MYRVGIDIGGTANKFTVIDRAGQFLIDVEGDYSFRIESIHGHRVWIDGEELAAENGKAVDRKNWRLVVPMHLAETREQARENVRYGLQKWIDYFTMFNPAAVGDAFHAEDPATALVESMSSMSSRR